MKRFNTHLLEYPLCGLLFWADGGDGGDGGDGSGDGTGDGGDPGAAGVGSALGHATGNTDGTSSTTVGGVTAVGDTSNVGEATSTNPNALGFNVSPGQGPGGSNAGTAASVGQGPSQGHSPSTGFGQATGDEGAAAAASAPGGQNTASVGGGTGASLSAHNTSNQFHGNSTLSNVAATQLGHQLSIYAQNLNDPPLSKLVNRINALSPHTPLTEVQNIIGANAQSINPTVVTQLNAILRGQTAQAVTKGQNPAQLAQTQAPPSAQQGYPGVGQPSGFGPGSSSGTNSNAETIATNALFGPSQAQAQSVATNALGSQHTAPSGTDSHGAPSYGTNSSGQPSSGTDSHGQNPAAPQHAQNAQDANALGATRAIPGSVPLQPQPQRA